MKRAAKKVGSKHQRALTRDPRIVPLIVPHGCAEAGRDFESAFDVLCSQSRVRELWRRPAQTKLAHAS
ncbi:MAG TPA: hypothetical protein VGF43_01605 [Dongiaceae bacterium]|jgi:hypothetical protein